MADHSSDSLAAWKADGWNLQCDGWIIRYPEYRRLHYYFHNYYLYVDDPSYDQTAEVVEDVIRNESGDSEDSEKYAGKRDQASMLKQQEEMQIVYEKYGTSPTGGCLPMLIQMPILFALYPVISNIPNYVEGVKNVYMPVVNQIMATDGFQKIMEGIGSAKPVLMSPQSFDYSQAETLVNVLYKFQDSTWTTLVDKMPSLEGIVANTTQAMGHLNSFLGINIGETPMTMFMTALADFSIIGIILAVIIPVLAGLTQFISVKLQPQPATDQENPMASSMKMMTYTMPLFSVFLGFTLPAGLGLYWAVSAIVRCVQQLAINKYLSKKSTEEMIAENQKKAAKKREKKVPPHRRSIRWRRQVQRM